NLLDAAARASREVTFELGVAGFHLVATLALLVVGVRDLATLVAVQLVARLAYAIAASATVRELPGYRHPPSARAVLRLAALPSFTQTAAATIQNGDVWLVHWFGGEAAAGLYTVAQRLASTATLPGAQLLRLLQPHTDRAAHAGDPSATAARALRTTGYAVVPIAAGGMVVAEPLCRLFGAEFAAGGDALLLMLPAFTALQFAWQLAQILFAHGWVGRWAGAQWLGAVAQAVAIAWLVPRWGATGAAAAALLGNALFLVVARLALGHRLGVSMLRTVAPSLLPAIATAAAALAALPLGLVAQLAAGGVAYTATIYALELRSNWRRLGSGLQGASGFGSTR
ncbi:MAG: hypothetical protein RL398_3264, partial [Planctomycetota bacterium]